MTRHQNSNILFTTSFVFIVLFGLSIKLVSCQDENVTVEDSSSSQSAAVSSESNAAESNRNALILNQLRALADISYNLLKSIENDDQDSLDKKKAKKSVMLPRIGRSPVVFPRIGVQKKSAIFQPRIGRDSPSVDDDIFVDDKRAIVYQPRIGRK